MYPPLFKGFCRKNDCPLRGWGWGGGTPLTDKNYLADFSRLGGTKNTESTRWPRSPRNTGQGFLREGGGEAGGEGGRGGGGEEEGGPEGGAGGEGKPIPQYRSY